MPAPQSYTANMGDYLVVSTLLFVAVDGELVNWPSDHYDIVTSTMTPKIPNMKVSHFQCIFYD